MPQSRINPFVVDIGASVIPTMRQAPSGASASRKVSSLSAQYL
jgi:hypothetical protein